VYLLHLTAYDKSYTQIIDADYRAGEYSMTIDKFLQLAVKYLRLGVLVTLLAAIAVVVLAMFGVSLPVRPPGHVELAYLAGAYWLTK